MPGRPTFNRRIVLKSAGTVAAGLAMPALWRTNAFAANQITVADDGGATAEAMRVAYYDPFEKATGVKVTNVAHDPDPTTQLKVLVDTNNPVWDVCMATLANVATFPEASAYFEDLQLTQKDTADVIPTAVSKYWIGVSVFAGIMAYRTDKFGDKGPQNWADFWNVDKFPGRRGLFRDIDGVLEEALMADGVPPDQVYPLDDAKVERGFKSLEKIKPHINVWWTTGAQLTQILQNGEVDMADAWGGRAYAAIAAGAPVKLVYGQGTYGMDGWTIPKGTPKADLARQFIRFTLEPRQQAIYASTVLNGPTNQKAFDFIAAERAALLPTSPENLKGLATGGDIFWAKNKARLSERYLAWILQ